MRLRVLASLILALATVSAGGHPSRAWAWPPTYGSEFNFGSEAMNNAWDARGQAVNYKGTLWEVPQEAEKAAAKRFADVVRERCGEDCTVTEHRGKFSATEYDVKFKDGYSFNISIDPACVEVQTRPETLEQMRSYEPRTQKFIFDVARSLGMDGVNKSAHFNVGIHSAFDRDPKGFLRFFVNYHNLPELSSGALGEDYANAPPLSHLEPAQKAALAKIVNEVNEGIIQNTSDLATRIQREVYTSTPSFALGGHHYQGISVKYVYSWTSPTNDKPFEFRAPRQPANAHERTLLAELMEKRMTFEKQTRGPIVFLDVPHRDRYTLSEQANRFRLYLAEMGADWDHFKSLLPKKLRYIPPDAFMSGKIDWNTPKDVANLKSYLPYVAGSDWARNRATELLETPEALASGKVPEILEGAKNSLGPNASQAAQAGIQSFAATIEEKHPELASQAHSGTAQCIVRELAHEVDVPHWFEDWAEF